MSNEFDPVRTLHGLLALDMAEVELGYNYGLQGNPEPSPNLVGPSFFHGWRNGAVDAGTRTPDEAQDALRADYALRVNDDPQFLYH